MIFTATLDTVCPGNNHFKFTISAAGREIPLTIMRSEVQTDADDAEIRTKNRIISFVKELNTTNIAQIRAALAVTEFRV